ncbi:MAG: helix-turn-helix domain-containing protein [Ruminococcus sp.]|nr:helix-turn-helix domain-containing protein [Ruminococcus sp.]
MINHPKKDIIQIAVRPGYVLIPREFFTLELSANEFRIYIVLLTYEDRKTHTCYPSLSTLAKAAGVTKKTAMKCVHLLEEKRLIDIKHTKMYAKDGSVLNGNLEYHFNPISWAVRYQNENKLRESARIQQIYKKRKRFAKRSA